LNYKSSIELIMNKFLLLGRWLPSPQNLWWEDWKRTERAAAGESCSNGWQTKYKYQFMKMTCQDWEWRIMEKECMVAKYLDGFHTRKGKHSLIKWWLHHFLGVINLHDLGLEPNNHALAPSFIMVSSFC